MLGLAEVTAEIHEALAAKRVKENPQPRARKRDEVWVTTPSGREYRLERYKSPHEEARYVVRAIREGDSA